MNHKFFPRSHGHANGFTLIELLVVVAIISLLAAILFPVFARARENSRRAACASNLKQMAIGFHQYLQDYDEVFPPYYRTSGARYLTVGTEEPVSSCNIFVGTCVAVSWPDLIYPYVKNPQVFNDPSNVNGYFPGCKWQNGTTACTDPNTSALVKPWTYTGPLTPALAKDGTVRSSRDGIMYGYDSAFGNSSNPRRFSEVAFAGEKLLLAEGTRVNLGDTVTNCGYLMARHFSGTNVAYVDGHVKWKGWTTMCQDINASDETKHLWFLNGIDF